MLGTRLRRGSLLAAAFALGIVTLANAADSAKPVTFAKDIAP